MTSKPDSHLVNLLAIIGGVVLALLVVVAFILLSGDGIDNAATTTTEAITTSVPAATTTVPSSTTTAPGSTTTTGGSTSTIPPFDGDVATKSNDTVDGNPGPNLTNVRVGDHPEDGYVRVVFDLTGNGTPLYIIGYETGPFVETSGDTVEVAGAAFLVVHISPARRHDIDSGELTYQGEEEFDPGADPIVEIQFIDDFEASMTWVIGLTGEKPFKVQVFQDPLRVVVDIAK
jgi:hypothetical protein